MFQGDRNLRGANELVQLDQDKIIEMSKCYNDIQYFAENYFYIDNLDEGRIKIPLYDFQKEILDVFINPGEGKKNIVINASRQCGKCVVYDTEIVVKRIQRKSETSPYKIKIGKLFEQLDKENQRFMYPKDPKFISSVNIWSKKTGYEVLTPNGFEPIEMIHKTKPFLEYKVKIGNKQLICADKHLVINERDNPTYVEYLEVGDKIKTKNGVKQVSHVTDLGKSSNMYDLTLKSKDKVYYTNDILSHNTTMASIFIVHYILFNETKKVAILANKERTAIKIFEDIVTSYQYLPLWMQQGILEKNKMNLKLENGCKIMTAATSSEAIRGFSMNLLFLDEFAFVPAHVIEPFMASVMPVLSSGKTTKCIIVSTPKGMNDFQQIYTGAIRGENNFRAIKIPWYKVPGRDEKWKQDQMSLMDNIKFNQEYNCKFLGSSSTLIESSILENLRAEQPKETTMSGMFNIYEYPIEGCLYSVGVDTGNGVGQNYSVVQVLKIESEFRVKQVATYRCNEIHPDDFSTVCMNISKMYNNGMLMVESNGGMGHVVTKNIWENFGYEHLANLDKKGHSLGITSNVKIKQSACLFLKRYLEKGWLNVIDKNTIYELARFEELKPNIFGAAGGKTATDDTVAGLFWSLYLISTDLYDGLEVKVTEENDKSKKEEYDEDYEPPMMLGDGDDNEFDFSDFMN